MGNCNAKKKRSPFLETELQSVIFYRNKIYKKEVIMWDESRAISYMLSRGFVWCPPPDISKHDQIRLHIEPESKYEAIEFQDVGSAITLTFGTLCPPEPRRKYLNIGHSRSLKKKKSNIYTLSDLN